MKKNHMAARSSITTSIWPLFSGRLHHFPPLAYRRFPICRFADFRSADRPNSQGRWNRTTIERVGNVPPRAKASLQGNSATRTLLKHNSPHPAGRVLLNPISTRSGSQLLPINLVVHARKRQWFHPPALTDMKVRILVPANHIQEKAPLQLCRLWRQPIRPK